MASHGGMLGVAIALWVYTRKRPLGLLALSDVVISTAPLGLFFGRIANFINGELWGETTRVPWGVIFERTGGGPFPRHPSQLYEAALEGIFLFCYVQVRFWKSQCTKLHPGQLSGEFLLLYALVRALGEFYREPDAGLILGLSRGTFYSVFLVAAGVALVAYARRPQLQRKA
ncbi:MAG: prolipoprotein diacylglyceryl transferase, partial [Opitutae bacterium]